MAFRLPLSGVPSTAAFFVKVLATSLPAPGHPVDGCQAAASFGKHCRLLDLGCQYWHGLGHPTVFLSLLLASSCRW